MAAFSDIEKINRINIKKEQYMINTDNREVVLVLLSGSLEIESKIINRESVFESEPKGFFMSNISNVCIKTANEAEFCLASAPSSKQIPLTFICKTNEKNVGHDNYQRKVTTLVNKDSGLSNLIVGETIKNAGNWSSWPPHKHDEFIKDIETKQKEIYLYKFKKQEGFGIQLIYDNKVSNPTIIRNNDEIKIEKGYHPVVSSPHSMMYYFWVLFGNNEFFKTSTQNKFRSILI